MKHANLKKVSTQQHLNNEYEISSIHDSFDEALDKAPQMATIVEVSDSVSVGDSVNENGHPWVSA